MSDELPELSDPDGLVELVTNVSTPDELRTLLDTPGVDDELIDQFIDAVGPEKVLDRVFDLMGKHFVPARAGAESGVVQWNVGTTGGQWKYALTIADGRAVGERGVSEGARVTLTVAAPTLLRLCSGRLDGVNAFLSGKVKLTGDMMFGAKIPGWFDY